MPTSAWITHVKAYQSKNGGTYKAAMINSKASYTRTTNTPARAKRTPEQKAVRKIKGLKKKFGLNCTVGK